MGSENQNVEHLLKSKTPEQEGKSPAANFGNLSGSELPKPKLTGAESSLAKNFDRGNPPQIKGDRLLALGDGPAGQADSTDKRTTSARLRDLMKQHDSTYRKPPVITPPPMETRVPIPPNPGGQPDVRPEVAKPLKPSVDQARLDRQKKIEKKVYKIDTSTDDDRETTAENLKKATDLQKLAKETGVPLVVYIHRSGDDDDEDGRMRPGQKALKTQVKESTDMAKVVSALADKEWGNAIVVQMEACKSAQAICKKLTIPTETTKGYQPIAVAPQVTVLSPSGGKVTKKHKTTIEELSQAVHSK